MSWIRVSIDAGTPETYAKVRSAQASTFEKVWHHIAELTAEFRAAGSDCLLGVGYVVTMENWAELHLACERAKEAGVPYVRVSAMFSESGTSHYGPAINEIRDEIARVKSRFEGDGFSVVNLFDDRIHDLDQQAPDYEFCVYRQFNMYFGTDLNVYRCCTTAYTNHGEVGSIKDRRLAEWFYSEDKKKAYGSFDARTCRTCQFNGKNRVINYLVNEHPIHVEFV